MKTQRNQTCYLAATGALLAGLLLPGCGQLKKAAAPPAPIPEVAVVTLRAERVTLTDELAGRVSAFLVAEVRPQVSGIIQKRLFEEGADVKAGDLLYQIDPAFYMAAHASAQAMLAKAEANRTSIRLRAERYQKLLAAKAVSQQDVDDVTAGLLQAEAEIEAAKAGVEAARINLAYTGVTAPISGRIGKSAITIGALATAHQAIPFTTIQQLDPVYVDVPQSSASLLHLKKNLANGNLKGGLANQAKVRLLLEDGTPYATAGTLQFSDVTIDPSTSSFILRMTFPNPEQTLLPGMYVRAVIEEGMNEQAIMAPQQGVTRDPKGNPLALVVDSDGKVQQRSLVLGRAIGNQWFVVSGLSAGDRVIVEGMQKVKPGSLVKAIPFAADRPTASGAAPAAPATATGK
ncbi:MAG: efflux RND transporter periplasmic adaptor subunit [Lentisphaeria bacterium]